MLKDFDAPTDSIVDSLWDKCYHSERLIDEHLLLSSDKKKMKLVGKKGLMRWLEAHSVRIASIAREVELELDEEDSGRQQLMEKFHAEEKVLKEKIKNLEDQVKKNLQHADRARASRAEKEVDKLKKTVESLKQELESECAVQNEKQTSWEKKETNLKTEIGQQLIDSFKNCLAQVSVLYPETDLSACGPFKEMQNGQIISPADSEETASNDEMRNDEADTAAKAK